MPQVDLETILCGGDAKISCETMIGGEDSAAKVVEEDPYMPAESFQVRIGEEIDWTDINAVYDRDDSTKGNTNPKSQHANQKQQQPQQPPSNSQRFSGNLKPKAPIIALPNKMQLGASLRRPIKGRTLLKTKISGLGRKSAVPPPEPGSPKVSCFGKVKLDCDRERRQHHQPDFATYLKADEERIHQRSGGCFAWLVGIFRRPPTQNHERHEESSTPPEKIVPWSGRLSSAATIEGPPAVAPGLGAMRRLSSGRRPASWGGDEDSDGDMHAALSAPLDRESQVVRRSVG